MNICIIGGSGFVGTHLVRSLNSENEVKIFDKQINPEFSGQTIQVDIRDKNKLIDELRNFDLVIHLAAEHKDNVTPKSLYYDVNVCGTENILQAMTENRINNIIFTSSVAVYGLNKDNPDEDTKEDPFNDYGKTKFQAEEVLRNWYMQNQTERSVAIVRPTVIFGENNRGNVYNLLKQIGSGRFVMIGSGKNEKSMAYVKNVTAFLEFIIHKINGFKIYNYVDKPDLTTNELIRTVEDSLSISVPPFRVPYWLGLMGGYCFDLLTLVSGKKYPISSVRVKKFCATTKFDAGKIREINFVAPYTISEGLTNTMNYEFSSKNEVRD